MARSMSSPDFPLLARVYNAVMVGFVERGRAPHYVELSRQLGLPIETARQALHQIEALGGSDWLVPGTDYVASFAPFSNVPTQYLVSVDGSQRWYAQCGFEALAVSWLFTGREVRVDCPCLDCGEPVYFRMRDGILLEVNPPGVVGHTNHPRWRWAADWSST